jgi:hypothetical protein
VVDIQSLTALTAGMQEVEQLLRIEAQQRSETSILRWFGYIQDELEKYQFSGKLKYV